MARTIKARDLCSTCYDKLWRNGLLAPKSTAATQILEVLELDGGWLTEAAIHLGTFNVSESAVHRALFRLREKGLVESRLGQAHQGIGYRPNEWRAA